jgi:hypothetical protein
MLTIRYATSDYLCHDPDCALCSADADYGEPLGHYRCQCCGEEDPELFMLRDDLWRRITGNQPELLLCWRCAESALGRPILPADLTKCPLNCQLYPSMMLEAGHDLDKITRRYRAHRHAAMAA